MSPSISATAHPDDVAPELRDAFVRTVLALADDKLMIGHRNSDWTGLAPILEEDIAFSSLAQDEIAHAAALYEFVAPLTGSTADQIAFNRSPQAYHCADITVLPDEFDWATALSRQFLCAHYEVLMLERFATSSHEGLAALSRRQLAEQHVHTRHASDWVERLGPGTPEAHERMQSALNALAAPAVALFEPVDGQDDVVAAGLIGGDDFRTFETWATTIQGVLSRSNLSIKLPILDTTTVGGRRGTHTPVLAELLDEMCEVFRSDPDAAW
ncbi:MAG: 1,2-phenylacetyl-CoA epoxidase subunit PaaC [Planctomycetota bacterium]